MPRKRLRVRRHEIWWQRPGVVCEFLHVLLERCSSMNRFPFAQFSSLLFCPPCTSLFTMPSPQLPRTLKYSRLRYRQHYHNHHHYHHQYNIIACPSTARPSREAISCTTRLSYGPSIQPCCLFWPCRKNNPNTDWTEATTSSWRRYRLRMII